MRKSKKVLIISTVAGLAVLGTTAGVAYSQSNQAGIVAQAAVNTEITTDTTTTELGDLTADEILNKVTGSDMISTDAAQKEETVYVVADATGASQKVIVSEWLKNPDGSADLADQSSLTDIKNVKGDETFTQGADGQLTWQAEGKDIYYQGTTTEELPLKLSIKYTLDGAEITPEELVGKSGKLVMTFSYENTQKVPFLAVSGMLLDNDTFTNVEVTNGKVINDGSKIVVVGAALPGVQDCLDVTNDSVDIPTTVEVTADVVDYSAVTSMTFVTNDLFNHINVNGVSDMDSLKDAMSSLTDATAQLVDGSNSLYEGLSTLADKSVELSTAVGALKAGADTLNTSIGTLHDGLGTLDAGIGTLNTGIGTLDQGIGDLSDGIGTLDAGLGTLVDGAKKVQTGAGQINDGLGALVAKNDTLNGAAQQVFTSLLTSTHTQLTAAGLEIPELTIDNYEATLNAVIAQLSKSTDAKMVYAKKSVQGALQSLQSYQQFYDGLAQYTGAVSQLSAGSKTLAVATEQLTTGAAKLATGSTALVSGSTALVGGSAKLVSGASTLVAGSSKLVSGSSALATGSKTLADGLGQLSDASGSLIDGVGQLKDGSKQLADGIALFNDTGIQKLVDMFDGDLSKLLTNVSDMLDTSKEYQSFGGITNDMTGSVKFIIKAE